MKVEELILLSRARALARSGEARALREAAGLSSNEIAEACDVAPLSVRRWESGERVPHGPGGIAYGRVLAALEGVPA